MVPGSVAVEVDAVHEQPVVAGQALRAASPRVRVHRTLGHVDVDADAEVDGQAGGRLQRARPLHVNAAWTPTMPAPALPQEPLVLGQPPPGAVLGGGHRAARGACQRSVTP